MSAAEHAASLRAAGYHRGLVYHEEGVPIEVVVERELPVYSRIAFLSIDAAMYGEGWEAAVEAEYLGRPSRGSQQHNLLP